jgi:beta-lactamase superfamily II metal-dependent hydrolase
MQKRFGDSMIQVDMFEVQLGASILLQFKTENGDTVRVLADAGQGVPHATDVHPKLTEAFASFGNDERRIDLLIGTHYDADHLDGLIPIIKDKTIAITEAWLPPIANDSERHAFDTPLAHGDLFPHQLYSSSDRQVLRRYLETKRRICEQLSPGEKDFGQEDGESLMDYDRATHLFTGYRNEALRELRFGVESQRYTHADDSQFDPTEIRNLWELFGEGRWPPTLLRDLFFHSDVDLNTADFVRPVRQGSPAAHNLAGIRKSAACDAINAISLAKVVEVLRARQIPVACHVISDGEPRHFVWRSTSRRFEEGGRLAAQGPKIALLGPSERLVRKHWNRLPIGTYAALARFALIPLKSITPSNQLSYVARFEDNKQGILVAGDAGCVDFRESQHTPYFPKLLDALLPLHVVQVAHHAGNNAHFYRVLLVANYPEQALQSFLLVSHATADAHRPSAEFSHFVQDVRRDREIVSVLFTAQPVPDKVRDFRFLVHPPVGPTSQEGDVRLEFRNGAWSVTRHSIAV